MSGFFSFPNTSNPIRRSQCLSTYSQLWLGPGGQWRAVSSRRWRQLSWSWGGAWGHVGRTLRFCWIIWVGVRQRWRRGRGLFDWRRGRVMSILLTVFLLLLCVWSDLDRRCSRHAGPDLQLLAVEGLRAGWRQRLGWLQVGDLSGEWRWREGNCILKTRAVTRHAVSGQILCCRGNKEEEGGKGLDLWMTHSPLITELLLS